MKIVFFLLTLLIEYVRAATYRKSEELVPSRVKVISKEEAPSLISCAVRCKIQKSDFLYDAGKCTCLVYLEDEVGQDNPEIQPKSLTGSFYKVIHNLTTRFVGFWIILVLVSYQVFQYLTYIFFSIDFVAYLGRFVFSATLVLRIE